MESLPVEEYSDGIYFVDLSDMNPRCILFQSH